MKQHAARFVRAHSRVRRKLADMQVRSSRARDELAVLDRQLLESQQRRAVDEGRMSLRDANEQLLISALNAHSVAERAERSRHDDVTSSERRARRELRAKESLAAMNVDLEARVAQRTRDLEAARDEALAAVQAKEQFLSNMSHEIRTPMNGMLGALELLSETDPNPKQAHYIEVAAASGEALLAVLNDVLDFAKRGSYLLQLDHSPIDVNAIGRSVVALFSAVAERKGIDLRFVPDPELSGQRLGDALHLRQVLLNLVGNAMKFTVRGEVVLRTMLSSEDGCEEVTFEVRDTGIGIEATQLQRIFEPFVQVDGTAQPRQGGTGLGLSISRQLVVAMGSDLTVESVPGSGSSFRFTLAFEEAPVSAAMPLDELPGSSRTDRLQGRVLLVEDNQVNQLVGTAMLESLGFDVVPAENGEEALARLADTSFDVVLMDCHMPVMDGYEATRRMRDAEMRSGLNRVPIVALTANAFPSDVTRCLDAGMDAHLAKPYSAKQLRAVIAPLMTALQES